MAILFNLVKCTYVRTHVRTHARTPARTHARTHARTYVRTYVRMYVCIYLFIYLLFIKTYLYRVVHDQIIIILFYSVALLLAKSKSSDNLKIQTIVTS